MPSFFYSTKNADSSIHQLPPSLDRDSVLGILHNDALLPRILWPNTIMADKQQTLSGIKGRWLYNDGVVHHSRRRGSDRRREKAALLALAGRAVDSRAEADCELYQV
ncbi:hypothetical protein BB8028_0005g01630 [Beauveria bassiana]|uniref:Uncharacterized protein n=1 Tax=Beauveria bassiana TaxID=176275 RepID=A0A2S7YFD0_BEABA|nr:hypothetical protein BB8028_0005g01630 [Beauveria bassiana]